MDKRFMIVIALVISVFVGLVVYNNAKGDEAAGDVSTIKGSNNVYGKLDSPVTLTEFVDFQCEACYAYYPYVKQLKEKYKDQVKFQVRYFPIVSGHQFAFQAARSAEAAARQGKFWEMHDKILEGQKTWERAKDPQGYFDSYAQSIGLTMETFKTDRLSSSVNDTINDDLEIVRSINATGTPTFVLNGKKIESPGTSLEAFSKILDDALAQSR